jgi:hypothetical protein
MVMEGGLFWYTTALATHGILSGKPFFRKVKTAVQKCIAFGGRISQVDTHLTIIYFTSGITILTTYSSGLSSLQWKSTAIHYDTAFWMTYGFLRQRLMFYDQRLVIPGGSANEVLDSTQVLLAYITCYVVKYFSLSMKRPDMYFTPHLLCSRRWKR